MPNLFDDNDDDDEGNDSSTDDSAGSSGESGDGKDPKFDKRIRDLQSKADSETARANKAETQLKRLQEAMKEPSAEDGKPAAEQTAGNVADAAVLEVARMLVFQQSPKLAEYGITATALSGSTPSEIAQSAVDLVAQFEKIETRVRNKVLADNGLAPVIDAGAPDTKRDFTTMPKDDFKKFVEEQMARPR